MNLSEEQLREVEEMAGLFFGPEEIAVNLELNEEDAELFKTVLEVKFSGHPIVAAYMRGWIQTEVELRKAIKQSALNGSSPSQTMMLDYQRNNRTI